VGTHAILKESEEDEMSVPLPRSFEKLGLLLGCLVVGGAIAPMAGAEEEAAFYGRAEVGFHNQYNFRGFKAGDWAPSAAFDLVIPVRAQSGLAFNLGAWYVDPIDDSYNEVGIYAYSIVSVADFQFRVGGIFFVFPSDDLVTGEFGAAVSYSLLDFVDLKLSWWSDVKGDGFWEDELRFGHYAEFSAEKSIELTNWLSVDLATGVSYGIDYYGSDGWNHAFATVDFPVAISETITLKPYVGGTLALEGLEDAGEDDQFLWGLRLAVGF
jgi:hypothetical protein